MKETEERPHLSIVIPVYNERPTIEEILRRVEAVKIDKEIILVDDDSVDGSREFLQELAQISKQIPPVMVLPQTGHPLWTDNIRVIFQEKNRGKGAALRRGFAAAQGENILVQDADLEYDPEDYYKLLEPIEKGVADVVYGSRFLGGPHRVLFFWHSVANHCLTTLSNMFTNLNLTDVWTCYKVFSRRVLGQIRLKEDRFGFEPEVTARIAKGGWRVYEIPISYHGRTYAEGKKITWKDGVKALFYVLRYNMFR